MTKAEKQNQLKVFRSLCSHSCDFMSCWIPLPTTVIAKSLGISLYQCRKAMRQLVAEGLAVSDSCVIDCENPLPYNGYTITEKGRQTGIYMYISLRSARICAECFDASINCFLPEDFDYRWLSRTERQAVQEYLDAHFYMNAALPQAFGTT